MVIGIDLDGTFCTDRYEADGVLNCSPLPGAIDKVTALRAEGHKIVFHTHRHAGLIPDTVQWLKDWGVRYDRIVFEKPHFDLYIGDEAVKFTSWDDIEVPT